MSGRIAESPEPVQRWPIDGKGGEVRVGKMWRVTGGGHTRCYCDTGLAVRLWGQRSFLYSWWCVWGRGGVRRE